MRRNDLAKGRDRASKLCGQVTHYTSPPPQPNLHPCALMGPEDLTSPMSQDQIGWKVTGGGCQHLSWRGILYSIHGDLEFGFLRAPGRQIQWYSGRGTIQAQDGDRHGFQERSEVYKCVRETMRELDVEHCPAGSTPASHCCVTLGTLTSLSGMKSPHLQQE